MEAHGDLIDDDWWPCDMSFLNRGPHFASGN